MNHHIPEGAEEADKVSVHIAEILSDSSFVFSPTQYISIHRRLFTGVFSHAGKIREYNIRKDEWVLDGASVMYGGALELRETFLRNLLMGENNELKNRFMHIRWNETTHSDGKRHIKQHIEQHIENKTIFWRL